MTEDATTRQWSFNVSVLYLVYVGGMRLTSPQAFEWLVRDVSRLRDYIENAGATEDAVEEQDTDDFDVLRESPELGDGKFKLEICASFLLWPTVSRTETARRWLEGLSFRTILPSFPVEDILVQTNRTGGGTQILPAENQVL